MQDFYYSICHAFCALSMGKQMLIGLVCVFIAAGVIYLALWGLKALLYRLAESVGICLDADYEPYEADWMDMDKWEEMQWQLGSRT